jgi:hypothetical protein
VASRTRLRRVPLIPVSAQKEEGRKQEQLAALAPSSAFGTFSRKREKGSPSSAVAASLARRYQPAMQ